MDQSTSPRMSFEYPEALRDSTETLLSAIEASDDPTEHSAALGDLVAELTDAGLSAYFLTPLDLAGVGFVTRQSAGLGIATTSRMMCGVIRGVINGLDADQLRAVCGYMRGLMR